MRTSRRIAAVAAALTLLTAAALPASAFEVLRHSSMTSEVLGRQGVGGTTLSLIRQGVRWPDMNQCLTGCYCPAYIQIFCVDPDSNDVIAFSPWHFDNNRLAEGIAHVETMMEQARTGLAGSLSGNEVDRRRVGVALMDFGRALHAIQDFYAHSTWIDNNRDLIRIGGRIESCPLWNGEQLGEADLGGITIYGTQTGYVDLPTPPGSVTHAALNKDAPGSSQGALTITRIFPPGVIGTKYEIASGQVGGGSNSYRDTGLAPRHTIKAWQCLQSGCAIYNLPESPTRVAPMRAVSAQDFAAAIAFVESDPGMQAAAARMDSIWEASDPDTVATYPIALFDADGWPLPANTSVDDLVRPTVRLLRGGSPNPSREITAIRFHAPSAGRVRLAVHDLSGRLVRVLLDTALEPGWKEVRWDGRGEGGQRVAAGAYLCRLQGFGHDESVRLTRVQ